MKSVAVASIDTSIQIVEIEKNIDNHSKILFKSNTFTSSPKR